MSQRDKDPEPKTTNRVCAILLAAGRSKRMGAFKPLLPFGNATVIESCINYLREGGVDDIVVVVGHRANEIQQHLQDSKVLFAFNHDEESEMAVSIACGTEQIPKSAEVALIALT